MLTRAGFAIEHLAVERHVRSFTSVEEGLAVAVGLQEKWRADGRWFRYLKFLEEGGRTLTVSHLHVKARRRRRCRRRPPARRSKRPRGTSGSPAGVSGRPRRV